LSQSRTPLGHFVESAIIESLFSIPFRVQVGHAMSRSIGGEDMGMGMMGFSDDGVYV